MKENKMTFGELTERLLWVSKVKELAEKGDPNWMQLDQEEQELRARFLNHDYTVPGKGEKE